MWHWLSEGQSRPVAQLPHKVTQNLFNTTWCLQGRGGGHCWPGYILPRETLIARWGAAKPSLMVIAWQWSGEPCTWMRWQELVLRGTPENLFPPWRTVDVVSRSGRNSPGGRTPGISLPQPQNVFCCTHPGAWLLQMAEFQARSPPCSSWCNFPTGQPLPWRVCLPHGQTGNSPVRNLPQCCDLLPQGSVGSSEASSWASLCLSLTVYGQM